MEEYSQLKRSCPSILWPTYGIIDATCDQSRAKSAVSPACSCKYSWTVPLSSLHLEFLLLDTTGLCECSVGEKLQFETNGSAQNTAIRVTYALD